DLLDGTLAVHRADLQAALADAAGEVRVGFEITAVEQTGDVVIARGAGGGGQRAELLIGADGLHSVVRRLIARGPPRPPRDAPSPRRVRGVAGSFPPRDRARVAH